jgi:hypothetical protein
MNQLLNISNFLGYTAYNNPMRAIRSGEEFGEIIPAPNWQTKIVKRDASVDETVAEMQKVIRKSAWQTKELSKRLLGKDLYTTCGNIWKFLFSHIKYKEDDKGKEQLREPSLSWYLRKIRGIDCDDFSIFAGTILYNLNIPFYLRIARYQGVNHFQHVYVIVPKTKQEYITIDAVLDEYDAEKETAETKDFLVMSNNNLNGIEVSVLGGLEDEALNEIAGILSGVDFGVVDELEGLGKEASEEDLLGAIYNHMVRTRNAVRRYPQIVRTVEDSETFAGMLEYGIKYWNTDKQELALGILEEKEEELNRLNGTDGFADGFEETTVFYGIEGLGGISALGKTKTKKTFFKNVKKAVQTVKQKTQTVKQNVKQKTQNIKQKAKQAAAKIKKAVVKNNPVSVAARTGMLVAMKTNLLKIAEKLKWGYLTESEARESGLDIAEWGNAKTQLKKAENLFVNKLKGSAEKFKQAILKGRAGGLKGVTEDLGAVVAATASASLAAAMPFIKQILEFAKGINMKKLIGKIKASKLMQKNKKAETMPEVSDDAPSALPEAAESENTSTESEASSNAESKADPDTKETDSENAETEKPETDNNISKPGSTTTTTNNSGGEEENNTAANTKSDENDTNLPATNSTSKEIAAKESDEPNVMIKVTDWVKENKGYTALIAGGLILAFSSTARKAIGLGKAPRKYKKRKGKKKNNPPKAISGVGKRKRKPKTVKRAKGKKPKQIRL